MKGEHEFEAKPRPQVDPKVFHLADVEKRLNLIREKGGHGYIHLWVSKGNIIDLETLIKEKP